MFLLGIAVLTANCEPEGQVRKYSICKFVMTRKQRLQILEIFDKKLKLISCISVEVILLFIFYNFL